MRNISLLSVAVLAAVLCGCAGTSLKQTWKAPDYQGGPVQKIAVLTVDERELYRTALENSFVNELRARGQAAVITYDRLKLAEVKADKAAAIARLQAAGADTVLIIRFADQVTSDLSVRLSPGNATPAASDFSTFDWHDYYMASPSSMDTVWDDLRQEIYLQSSLHDLQTGKRIWSGVTRTVIKESTDRLALIQPLTTKVLAGMRKDGMIR